MEDCCNCLSLKKQLEDIKQKHLLDFRTIKQKIISTDSLIRSYREKCQEFDKQKKCVVELVSKLDIAQRSADVVKLQLKKSFELVEPLQKKCNELEREKVLLSGEIQAQQDRLRGLENLVSQLQSVIKENEASTNSLKLDASLHTDELEEYKKSQKNNEAQISKLNEQVLTEKKTNKALNKELTKSQNQVKTLLGKAEEAKKLIATLQQQQNTGQSNDCEQRRNTLLEKQIMILKTEAEGYKETIRKLKEELRKAKQQNTDEKSENKIKSPTTPRRLPRKRKSVTPKQEKESCASLDQKKPLTRLQQKHLIEEIEKKSIQVKSSESISPSRQESLTSESEDDADEMETLLDKVNEMLDMSYCPSLSPLPLSPILDAKSIDAFGNNDPDYLCDDNDDNAIDNDNQKYIGETDEPDKNYPNDGNVNNNKDNLDDKLSKDDRDKILQNESRGKKRELVDCSDTFMTLRSKKRIKSTTSDSGPSSNDENNPQNVKKTKSVEGEPVVNVSVTGSKSVDGVTEGVLEVKPKRRRRRRRLSSNDDPEEQSFESSDTSTVESHVTETRQHSSDSFTAENGTNMETVVSEASDENCSEKKGAETNYKKNDEVLNCLQDIIDTVADENSGKICDASKELNGTESCTQSEQIGALVCFDVVNDLVVKLDSDLSTLQEDLVKPRDHVVKEGDKIDDHNENNKTAKTEILDSVDDINTTVSDVEVEQSIKNKNAKSSDNEYMDHSVSTRTIENDLSSSSFDGSGHPKATSHDMVTKNTCKIQHEAKHKASTVSDCVSTSSEEVTRTIESDLSKSLVDENGFLKATSHDLVTTSTCKTQQEPKDKASTISDCLSASGEKAATRTDGNNLNKSSFDKNGSPNATSHDLITTNTCKIQHETKHEASTISDYVSASNEKQVIRTDANDLNSLSVDESGFPKATSPDLVTTNTCKIQRETKHKASAISDCVFTSSEDVTKTIESDYSKLSVDESGFLKAKSPDLVTTNTCKTQHETKDKASTISDSFSTSTEKGVTSKSSVHESGFLKNTSPHLIATNTHKSQQEPKDEASAISDCVFVSNEEEVIRSNGNDLSRSSVDENGFLKVLSHEKITTNTRKIQRETKDKASTISDCVSTSDEKEVTRTDGNYLSKSSVDKSRFPKATSHDLFTKDNLKTDHETKHKASTVSNCVSTSNEKEIDRIIENDLNKLAFNESGIRKALSSDSVTKNTRKTRHETSKEAVSASENKVSASSEKSTTQVIDKDPMMRDEITSTTSPSKDSFDALEQITPLSPIPNTPKKGGRSTEIPCFDSLSHLPLSPIPPSPPPRADEENISSSITFDENLAQSPKEAHVHKQQKLNKNELPQDCLRRYPGVNEVQYTVFILTKLKNKEIALEDLISAFSVQKNVKNHNPICNGIITVLKLTHEDGEHALMEKCAEHYERCCEGTGDPIVSEFELQVLIAVKRLCKIQRHSNLLKKLVKWSGMNICELFNSEKNDAGLLAMCRLYTGASRLMGEGSYIRVLCYDILKQNKRYLMTERMILAMALVWPKVLGEGIPILNIYLESVKISGPPHSPFLATLHVTLMSREISCEQTRQCLQRLCGWCDIPRDNSVLEWLARDLVRILRVTNDATSDESPECSSTIKDVAFESIKSLALLAIIMGWKWTNDVLIREILWPFFNEWKIQLFGVIQTVLDDESQKAERVLNAKASNAGECQSNIMVVSECVNNEEQLVENSNETVCFKHDGNMDVTIANILHLLGVLGSERLQKGEIVNLDAVINLMCAIVARPACEKVSFNIQHTAASALLDIVSADPVKIIQVLEHWRDSNDTLTALPIGAGSPQQHMSITVGPPPNPTCQLFLWEETGVPGENPRLSAER